MKYVIHNILDKLQKEESWLKVNDAWLWFIHASARGSRTACSDNTDTTWARSIGRNMYTVGYFDQNSSQTQGMFQLKIVLCTLVRGGYASNTCMILLYALYFEFFSTSLWFNDMFFF
jgi:hypothetical protein